MSTTTETMEGRMRPLDDVQDSARKAYKAVLLQVMLLVTLSTLAHLSYFGGVAVGQHLSL